MERKYNIKALKAKQFDYNSKGKLKGANVICELQYVEKGEIKEKTIFLTPRDLTIASLKKAEYFDSLDKA